MAQKGHIMVQKGLKVHKKKAKNRVFGPKKKVFFLGGIDKVINACQKLYNSCLTN